MCSGKWTPSAVVSFRCSNPVTNVIKPQSQAAHFIRRTQDKLKPVYTCLIGWRTLLLAAVIKGGVILIISWLHSAAVWMSKPIEFFYLLTRLCLSRYHPVFQYSVSLRTVEWTVLKLHLKQQVLFLSFMIFCYVTRILFWVFVYKLNSSNIFENTRNTNVDTRNRS